MTDYVTMPMEGLQELVRSLFNSSIRGEYPLPDTSFITMDPLEKGLHIKIVHPTDGYYLLTRFIPDVRIISDQKGADR